MRSADLRALAAVERLERNLNPGTAMTLGWLLDEVDATRGTTSQPVAIRILIADRAERGLWQAGEEGKVLDMLERVERYRAMGGLADTFSLTDLMRGEIAREEAS